MNSIARVTDVAADDFMISGGMVSLSYMMNQIFFFVKLFTIGIHGLCFTSTTTIGTTYGEIVVVVFFMYVKFECLTLLTANVCAIGCWWFDWFK